MKIEEDIKNYKNEQNDFQWFALGFSVATLFYNTSILIIKLIMK